MPIIRKGKPTEPISIRTSEAGFKPKIMLKIITATALATNIIPPIFSLNQATMTPTTHIIINAVEL